MRAHNKPLRHRREEKHEGQQESNRDLVNKALKHELTAVNQYWLHYRLLDNWGYKELAKVWRKESIEEMVHADKLIERIIFLDGAPNMQTLESPQYREDREGYTRQRLASRVVGALPLYRSRDPLPFGQRLRHAGSV